MIFLFVGEYVFRQKLIGVWIDNFIKKYGELNIFHIKDFSEYDQNFYTQNLTSGGLFAEKKLFIIDDFPITVKENEEITKMQDYFTNLFEHISGDIILVFNNQKVDKRSKLYKKIKELGEIKDFEITSEKILTEKLISIYQDQVSNQAIQKMIQKKGMNFSNIKNELDKLLILKQYIDVGDLENISKEVEESIFLIIDNLLILNTQQAIYQIKELSLNLGNNYLLYNSLLANLRVYFYIFYYKQKGFENNTIIGELALGNRGFLVGKNYKISKKSFNKLYLNLINIDQKMKTGTMIGSDSDDLLFEIEKTILLSK